MAARRFDDESGMVTAEAAVAIPSLLLVLAMGLGVLLTVHAQMRAVDAAREAARLAARGEQDAVASAAGLRLGPSHARLRILHHGHEVEAVVTAAVQPFPMIPSITVRASTRAEREQP